MSPSLSSAESDTKKLPVDPGCLPAWDVGELPEPRPFTRANWIRLIGPGLVMAGGAIGTGEWVMGPKTAAMYQGAMMWVVIVSIVGQVILNTEVMRYTLCTGEPVMTAFLRTRPGPRFWLAFYILLDFGSWLPALGALAAQILVVAFKRVGPNDPMTPDLIETVRYTSYAVFIGCAVLVLFGGKIYNTLEYVLGGKLFFVLFYLIFCDLLFVHPQTWGKIWYGLINPFLRPSGKTDWPLVAALAGYAGIGGLGNIMGSNFVREKGWGMGAKVGAIPSAFGGHHITLSHIGMVCRVSKESVRRFRGWWQYLIPDQYLIWALGSLMGMMLPCMLGAQYLKAERLSSGEQWRWAAAMAQDFGEARGEVFRILTLLCGLVILVPGQYSVVDGVARRWCDAVWSGFHRFRQMDTHKVKNVYYTFAGAYVLWGLFALTAFKKLSGAAMMVICGNMANLAIAASIFHTLYVNLRFLPREFQPSKGKQVALFLSGVFFLTMFGIVVNYTIVPLFHG